MNRVPPLKPLAIVEYDELQKLKLKKQELEERLRQKENNQPKYSPKEESSEERTIFQKTPKKEIQQNTQKRPRQQENPKESFADLKLKQQQENEIKDLKGKVEHLQKEKKLLEKQFELVKESLRQEMMSLKEQSMKNKLEADQLQKTNTKFEETNQQTIKENKKLKNDYKVLLEQQQTLLKQSAEYQAKSSSNKDVVSERDNRIKWLESKVLNEENAHKSTLKNIQAMENQINNLKKEIEWHIRERERVTKQVEDLILKQDQKNEDGHSLVIKLQRDINENALCEQEYKKQLASQQEKIRMMELQRERHLQQIENMQKLEHKLQARDREIIELEVELDKVKRMRGTHIIEKIVEPVRYDVPYEVHVNHPQVDNDIVSLREDLLYVSQERDRALDEADYWRKRYQDLEMAGDRNINLMAHQQLDELERNNQLRSAKSEILGKVMGLINDLNVNRRNTHSVDVKNTIDIILQNNSSLIQYLTS